MQQSEKNFCNRWQNRNKSKHISMCMLVCVFEMWWSIDSISSAFFEIWLLSFDGWHELQAMNVILLMLLILTLHMCAYKLSRSEWRFIIVSFIYVLHIVTKPLCFDLNKKREEKKTNCHHLRHCYAEHSSKTICVIPFWFLPIGRFNRQKVLFFSIHWEYT